MNRTQITHKQHYVFQAYLRHWEKNDKVWCSRNGKLFSTNTLNIAQERDFYRIKDMNEDERQFVLRVFGKNPRAAEILKKQMDLYASPYKWKRILDFVKDFSTRYVYDTNPMPEELKEMISEADHFVEACTNDLIEETFCDEEGKLIEYIDRLIQGNMDFYSHPVHENESSYDNTRREFLSYICMQFFRTKAIRIRLIEAIESSQSNPPPPEIGFNMANIRPTHIVFHISWFASCQLADMLYDCNAHLTLLRNNTDIHFITTDQPIINLAADYKNHIDNIDQAILYYPLSPQYAITINDRNSDPVIDLSSTEVDAYNRKIMAASLEFVFADSRELLERYSRD